VAGWTRSAGGLGAVVRNAGGWIPLPQTLASTGTVAEADCRPGMADHALRHLLVVTAWCYQVLNFDTNFNFDCFYMLKTKVKGRYLIALHIHLLFIALQR